MTTHHQLRELAVQAITTSNAALAGRVLSTCRDEFGFSDTQAFQFVAEWTLVSLATWNALVEDVDNDEQCR
jgi:hypothetical protein